MTGLSRMGLGTAQFGMNYGVSNKTGRPDEPEIARILARAVDAGTGYLDTASSYGDAEKIIGRYLPKDHRLRIVTKIPPAEREMSGPDYKQLVLDSIAGSLRRLKLDRIHGVLIHRASDLDAPGWEYMVDAMQIARARGWTSCIGASVYDDDQVALVESRLQPDIIQLPCNALDRRLVESKTLKRLKLAGVEIHARSIFWQGLLLMPADQLPPYFAPVRAQFSSMREYWAIRGVEPLVACLASVLQQPEIDAAIVGVNHEKEFCEIVAAVSELSYREIDVGSAPSVDPIYLDPSKWPSVIH